MDLPTYTSIWRIEKRLYKLYDFRLPMPLPVGQIIVFAAITVPYIVFLSIIGVPLSHSVFWLYVLPPGVLTWLTTRPVLESKRLPELISSHIRYLGEPRTWCRMAPLAESDDVALIARVWRRSTATIARGALEPVPQDVPAVPQDVPAQAPARPEAGDRVTASGVQGAPPAASGTQQPRVSQSVREWPAGAEAAQSQAPAQVGEQVTGREAGPGAAPPLLVVPAERSPARPSRTVERVLGHPRGQDRSGWRHHVVIVPGGRGPGRPDHEQRDAARALLPLGAHRLIVVLGCTVGAGQTVTTLMLADLLAGLRGEPVAALDLNPGPASLTALAGTRVSTVSALLSGRPTTRQQGKQVRTPGEREGLEVICHHEMADAASPGGVDYQRLLPALASRYRLTLADPGAQALPRVLALADGLVLVAPASPEAAQAVAMTWEWLGAHGHDALAADSIMVVNGLSRRSLTHAEQAELVVRGRCRAIVRVPWDDHLAATETEQGVRDSLAHRGAHSRLEHLRPPVAQAYTALAGVLISSLATGGEPAHGTPNAAAPATGLSR